MTKLVKIIRLGLVGLGLTTLPSYGSLFDYAYTFGNGEVVSGTVTGDPSGNIVDNISAATVNFNGNPMPGTVYVQGEHEVGSQGIFVAGDAQLSFDGTQNNFLFANIDVAQGDSSSTWSFFESYTGLGDNGIDGQLYGFPINFDFPLDGSNWSLTPVITSAVPEPAAYGAYASAGMLLLSLGRQLRRKLA